MARIRSIKPEFFDDPDMASDLSLEERLVYIGLWTMCFDNWTMEYDPRKVRRTLFGYDAKITDEMVAGWVARIVETGRAVEFSYEGRTCLYLPKCNEHQVVNRPSKSPIPHPQPSTTHGGLTECSQTEGKGREQGEEQGEVTHTPARVCTEMLQAEYGTFPTPKQGERIRILADRYDDAPKRIEFGIARARSADKLNIGYALACAEGASVQELSGSSGDSDLLDRMELA